MVIAKPKRLDKFNEGAPVIGLGNEPFASHDLAVIGHFQIL
jgi:hypothetical protein